MNKISNHSTTIFVSIVAIIFLIIFVSLQLSEPLSGFARIWFYIVVIWGIGFIIFAIVCITAYYDIAINDNALIVTSAIKEKRFVIAEIEIIDIKVTSRGSFSISILADKFYSFYFVCYTKENFKVLQELIEVCKKSPITTEDLKAMVKKSFASLK